MSEHPTPDEFGLALGKAVSEPYLEVFGRFWDGMSFLIMSSSAVQDRLAPGGSPGRVAGLSASDALNMYYRGMRSGTAEWPSEFLLWQSYAYTVIEAHGLLDEYLRATFELLTLGETVLARLAETGGCLTDGGEPVIEMERAAQVASERFETLPLGGRIASLRQGFALKLRLGRTLEAALKHQRQIRNGIVHGQLTPHVVMPEGRITRIRAYPPPPYVPLGMHVVRGAMSVMLAAHRKVDEAIVARLGIEEDALTTAMIEAEISSGRDDWFADPWEPHPEHLFDVSVLRAWRPSE